MPGPGWTLRTAEVLRVPKALNILVAEDEPVNLQVLELMLASLGHVAWGAASGPKALAVFDAGAVDLVLTDLHMPGMDGEALLAEIRGRPQGLACPVIAVTADVMSHPPGYYLGAGFAGFLSKPLLMNALAQALDRLALGLPAVAGRLPLRRAG